MRRATVWPYQRYFPPDISIHALLAESDGCQRGPGVPNFDFYPRSPCGERPRGSVSMPRYLKFLSTLSLRRATNPVGIMSSAWRISIHALLAESDLQRQIEFERYSDISIHALLAESDHSTKCCGHRSNYFYPRSPCGERHIHAPNRRPYHYFYPRSPCGERPTDMRHRLIELGFLSTLSLRRATRAESGQRRSPDNFYPRSPCGERPPWG